MCVSVNQKRTGKGTKGTKRERKGERARVVFLALLNVQGSTANTRLSMRERDKEREREREHPRERERERETERESTREREREVCLWHC